MHEGHDRLVSTSSASSSHLVSAVIPTTGRRELVRALKSVLSQDYDLHEVIVVADTLKHVEIPADPRIRMVRIGPGAGGNAARQRGILEATGDLVALLDDDDEWTSTKLTEQLDLVNTNRPTGLPG